MEMGLLKSRNLLQPYDPPEAESYPANARDKEKAFTAIYARNFVMGYNIAMLSENTIPAVIPAQPGTKKNTPSSIGIKTIDRAGQ